MNIKQITASLFLALALLSPLAKSDTGTVQCYDDFMRSADASGKPQILYTGITRTALTMRSGPDKESAALGNLSAKETVSIFGFDQTWLFCWDDAVGAYYLGRHNVDTIEPIRLDTPAYGVIPNRFLAITAKETALRQSPQENSESLFDLEAGTRLSFWMINGGWAVVPYRREVGYLWLGDVQSLAPVSPTIDYAQDGDVLAVFTSFYPLKQTELNIGRMENIRVGCEYITRTYQPGEVFDFNEIAGPYREARGYKSSPVLIDGETVAGYGGGTCQVSTTLYNALLQLPEGIDLVYRRPHGPGGASYAPHGVDAAVGAATLNLIFRNDFPFPITLDCSAVNGSLCVCVRKGEVHTIGSV